jgi:hypothetical protein
MFRDRFWVTLLLSIPTLLLGHWIEMRSISQASDALLLPSSAQPPAAVMRKMRSAFL